ncbi:ATP-binding protein [Mameliella alba]|uniref:ATP-binding protein n=1 Tax=Mameliella alba TaxID=561184 RepID=UPI000B537787|nr:ATP-binding protein [Mameliella alba]OWV39284.1 two-component sensor histidine kinase [Mameliella alba]OWV52446.1 two-component sensor histidine kinase [Mameliella alba]BBU53882.1 two-component sensor histidine kinase [Mameliella alba]
MTRVFGSLRAQLILLIVGALIVAQTISLFLFVDERSLAIRAALGFEAAGRAANVARLLEEAPQDLQASILRAANSPLVRFELSDAPNVTEPDHHHAAHIEARVRALLGDGYSGDIRVNLREIETPVLPLPNLSPEMAEMHRSMMQSQMAAVEMTLSIAVAGGQWLNVGTRFERPPLQWPVLSTFTFALTAALILVSVCWFLLTRLTGPLRRLSGAADRLGRGEDAVPLPEVGPTEVEDLTRAFNRMQDRLTRFVADRTRVLAAVGHDLRSPLTALRVRAELVEDEETRESLIESIEEMQVMAEATLNFAEDLTSAEEPQTVEIGGFLAALAEDMVEPVDLAGGDPLRVRVRPVAFRRAIRNLVENALRYGGSATIDWRLEGENLVISILDTGPGIPAGKLEQVFDPFFRLEESRSLETGGHGLGLSIARSIVRAHGGEIHLENRQQGGLAAHVQVPFASPFRARKPSDEKETEYAAHNPDDEPGSDAAGRRTRGCKRRLAREV